MLVLLHGENPYSLQNELKKQLEKNPARTIYGDSAENLGELIVTLQNYTLFDTDNSITVIKNLGKNRKKLLANELADFIDKSRQDLRLIFYEEGKFDARTKLFKLIKQTGKVIELKPATRQELLKWIEQSLAKHKIKADSKIINNLLDKVSGDQLMLENEIEKLRLLLKNENRTELAESDLSVVSMGSTETVIWDLMDSISRRNKAESLRLLEGIMQTERDFPYVSTMFAKQLKLLYLLRSGSVSETDLTKELKIHPYVISKARQNARKFEPGFLKLLYDKLANLDFKVKQGKIDAKLGLIMLFASI